MLKILRKPMLAIPLVIIVAILGVFIYGKLFGLYTYSDGQRSGTIIKYADKGFIVKRGEGELLLNEFGVRSINAKPSSTSTGSGNTFIFNVRDKELKKQLKAATGRHCQIEYRELLIAPWYFNGHYEGTGIRFGEANAPEPPSADGP